MKKNLPLILICVFCFFHGLAEANSETTFKIIRLNTPTIKIGKRQLKVGDTFKEDNTIEWADSKQAMEVKDVSTGDSYKFSEKVFKTKGVTGSIADFFLKTSQGSSRELDSGLEVRRSPFADRFTDKRIALVIGNSNYENLTFLRNAQKDASDIADALSTLGFDVVEVYETDYPEMMTALNRFASQAKNYDVALFYYAGHGMQYEGKNYLLPVTFENTRKSELDHTLHADDIVQRMEDSGVAAQIIFIDACRNIPTSWSRSAEQGLARMEGGRGSVIVFSTESGKTADDGDGDNSPFATALINNLAKQISFDETLNGVVKETMQLTDSRQFPLRVGMLLNDFRFNPEGMEIARVEAPKTKQETKSTPPSKPAPISGLPSERFEREHPNAHHDNSRSDVNQQGFKVECDIREIGVKLGEVYRSGNNLIVDLILTNRTRKTLTLNTVYGSVDRMAVTTDGEKISWGDIRCKLGPYENADLGFKLVPNVPIKLQIWIEGLTSPDQLGYLNVDFYLSEIGNGNFVITRQ